METKIYVTNESHTPYAEEICRQMEDAAKKRGTGIAKRTPKFIKDRMKSGHAVIALSGNKFAGFSYINTWDHKEFVSNSGLIVHADFRKTGLARRIKDSIFQLSRKLYPEAKIFGITTSPAVMKINSGLGYRPVIFNQLPDDDRFWNSCSSCPNYDILNRTGRKHCLCTSMMFDPEEEAAEQSPEEADSWDLILRAVKNETHKAKKKLEEITTF